MINYHKTDSMTEKFIDKEKMFDGKRILRVWSVKANVGIPSNG